MKGKWFVLPALAGWFTFAAPHCGANTLVENFSTDPLQNGWRIFGDTNLFRWNSTNRDLTVTWDSTKPNSYFYKPLGTILAIDDNFKVELDLTLSNAEAVGYFELAVGLFNLSEATNENFSRALGNTPDLFEFDYYPDGPDSYGPSIDASMTDMTVSRTNESDFYFVFDNVPLDTGVTYHVVLTHTAGSPTIGGEVLTNGQVYASLTNAYTGPITDFRLDTLSINSYSAAGDIYGDSVLAHGVVDNFVVTLPPPPVQDLAVVWSNNVAQVQFDDRTNWLYTLQRTTNFQEWTDISAATPGNGTNLFLRDFHPPADTAFYRLKAQRP